MQQMRVIDIVDPGPRGRLVPAQQPVPKPGAGEVLIEVHAAGVNGADLKQRQGQYPGQERAPSVPGLEVAGVVAALGEGVTGWQRGDRVCALVYGGGYAEYCVAPAVQCLPIPAGLDFVQGAALPEVIFTVWIAIFEQARLLPGETLLVHGGASGVGTMAIQMATAFGAFVIGTGRGANRCATCVEYGAEHAIDTSGQDFVGPVFAHTGGRGVDVVLCMAGASYLQGNLKVLVPKGRLCYVAADGGRNLSFDLLDVSLRNIWLTGVNLRFRSVAEKGRIAEILRARIWPMIERGRIRPVVGATIPLERAAEAHALLEGGRVPGKVILSTR